MTTGVHKIYESLQGTNLNHSPTTSPTWWVEVGPTNRWAMFDERVGTQTVAESSLTVVLRPGGISAIALLELAGRQVSVVMKDLPGGTVVYSKTVDLDGTIIDSFYDWFYEPYEQLTDLVLTDLPAHFQKCELTITISTTSGNVSCGVCKPGELFLIGASQYGAKLGISSCSRKDPDEYGRVGIKKRSNSKKMTLSVDTDSSRFNKIYRKLAKLDAVACIWIATEVKGYESMILYGFFKDFYIDIPGFRVHYCSLEIEGLI